MPSYVTPRKNSAFVCYVSLVSQADTDIFQSNPTLANSDAKVSKDGGALTNLATLPDVYPAAGKMVRIQLSADEMNADNVAVVFCDAAGDEWQDLVVSIQTTAQQIDDIPTVAAIADAVWDELTSGHAVSGSFGVAITGLVTSMAAVATTVWAAATRTLTSTAATVADAVSGNDLTLTAGVTFNATLTGLTIPATWTKIYLTAKVNPSDDDDESILQLVETNPGDADDGLLYLDGAAPTAADEGSLTVDQAAGTIGVMVADDASADFLTRVLAAYDVKCLVAAGTSSILTIGGFAVIRTETTSIT